MTKTLKPSAHDQSWTGAFVSTPALRELRVLIDDAAYSPEPQPGWNWQVLLSGLLTHKQIAVLRYADDGPPSSAPRMGVFDGVVNGAIGWLEVTPATDDSLAAFNVSGSDGTSVSQSVIFGDVIEAAACDITSSLLESLPVAEAAAIRRADAIAVQAAQSCAVDIFITDRRYLHAARWALTDGVTICTPREGLELVGLYLRSRAEYLTWHDPKFTVRLSKGGYFMVGARELLSAGWKWLNACVEYDRANQTEELTLLGVAVFQRVSRALQARDGLLRALSVRQDANVVEDALREFDVCMVFLMGALDAAARVAHQVVGHSAKPHNAGWQRPAWMTETARRCPELGAVLQAGSANAHALTILKLMRNTVHDAGLQAVNLAESAQPDQTLIGLARSDQTQVVAAVEALGGLPAWGLYELIPGELHADPHVFLEKLFPAALTLLNDLMNATPVETLPGYALSEEDTRPPEGTGMYGPKSRDSIHWQLGLQASGPTSSAS